MSLIPGTRLGPYDVVGLLGAGGMGEVYRARDTRLRRDVAIKILPANVAADPERRARFAREAQVLAALNHPHIAAIYGIEEAAGPEGLTALVLELVEGPTLADLIAAGGTAETESVSSRSRESNARQARGGGAPRGLSIDDTLRIATQIADALEAAHEQGIVHRDLKPANIKVRTDGTVKVLDFGLAKALGPDDAGVADAMNSPTMTGLGSRLGVILGTAAYMSPEQAKGKVVDTRTDIWAFGCVLYEMVTGTRAFDGDDVTDFLVAVMTKEPDWSRVPPVTPPRLVRLLKRCLKKDARQRLRDIGDARADLEPGDDAATASTVSPPAPRRPATALAWLIAGVAIGAVVASGVWLSRTAAPDVPSVASISTRFSIPIPPGQELLALDISADGQQLVYVAGPTKTQLYHRLLNSFDVRPIAGTEGADAPFFSPDGQWVGFFAAGKLKKVALRGGTPSIVCDARGVTFGAAWLADAIVFSSDPAAGLMRVMPEGGKPEPLTTPNRNDGEIGHLWPHAMPDGRSLVFTVRARKGLYLAAWSAATRTWRRMDTAGRDPRYVTTGHLLYSEGDNLLAAPFDVGRLEITGGSTPVLDEAGNHVTFGQPMVFYAAATNGTLIYAPNALSKAKLMSVDLSGKASVIRDEGAWEYTYPRVSPDGRRIAAGSDMTQLWIYDLERPTKSRLTTDGVNYVPVWSPDGSRMAYATYMDGAVDIVTRPSDLSAPATVAAPHGNRKYPIAWTRDDRLVFQESSVETGGDIKVVDLKTNQVKNIVATASEERNARLSRDGRWIAYMSDESGRFEIYVRPFDRPEVATPISDRGGNDPVWSPTDDTLYYFDGKSIVAARYASSPSFRVLSSSALFTAPYLFNRIAGANYDVMPDGKHFLMVSAPQLRPMQINVVLNWFSDLRDIVPAKR